MKACFSRFASLLLVACSMLSFAQEAAGIVSYIDIEGAGTRLADCVGDEPDPRACTPNVETLALASFQACRGNLSGCEGKVSYPVPFIPETSGTAIEANIDTAWETFVNQTIDEVGADINKLLPCWLPTPCPPQVNWSCVSERMADALATAYREYLPEYWAKVYESIATHAPFALHWHSAFPGDGAVIAPVFSLIPKFEQYVGLIEEPRDPAYYFQGPLFPRLPVPYVPDELSHEYGGMTEKEEAKRTLAPATLLEYQQFGFVILFEVYGEFRLELLFKLARGPYLYTACLILVPPFVVPVPIPVPTPVYVPRAFSDWPSVPEGYGIPRIKGVPLY